MNSRKALAFSSLLGTFLAIALFGILIAGCGSSEVGATTPTSKPTAAAMQKCGTIGVMRTRAVENIPGSVKANVAGNCFWQAFQQCQTASLVVNFGGVDTVTTHTFTLQKKDANCTISDAVKNRIIPRPAKNVGIYTCSGLVSAPDELRFNGCGTLGNIVVPTSQVGNSQ
ncbi:MAG: hypothetical protein JO031_16995 [Ktedonobacteraceae bacterium]|nr:hypothetical protein [Ktedonobacteraceae bacterium]